MKDKDAILELNLNTDSGYSTKQKIRINLEQWGLIQEIINPNEELKLKDEKN